MSRFDELGLLWEPETFKVEKRSRTKVPKQLPPIPHTGWKPRAFFPDLSGSRVLGFDTETFDPDLLEKGPGVRRDGKIVGISLATEDFSIYYPIAHSLGENLDRDQVLRYVGDQLSRPEQIKVGANLLYDLDYLAEAGVEVKGKLYDVLYADPLINEYQNRYNLEAVADRRLGEHKETSLLYQWSADAYGGEPDGSQRKNIFRCPSELVGPYAEQDARLPVRIIRKQWDILQAKNMIGILEMECGLIPLLLAMRRRGCPIDQRRRQEVDDDLTQKIEVLQKELGINIYVATEIQALCDANEIEYPLTATGKPSFTKGWLKSHTHEKLRQVSELRGFYKLRDTFIRGSMLNSAVNGRVHCEFHPLRNDSYGTVSGRFSSSHPNLQQIPARDPFWGPLLRSCFIPEEGYWWMKNDLSQIEFRLGVHFGVGDGIEEIREEYRRNRDTDFYTLASNLTGLGRPDAKALSLGSMYGMGFDKFASMIAKPEEEARSIFRQYHRKLPFLRATYNAASEEAASNAQPPEKEGEPAVGFIHTIGGRLCNIDEGFYHKALNRKLQASCADWIKKAMLDAYQAGVFNELAPYLTVHDELDSGVPKTKTGIEAALELHRMMENAYPMVIPAIAGIDIGPSWGGTVETNRSELLRLIGKGE